MIPQYLHSSLMHMPYEANIDLTNQLWSTFMKFLAALNITHCKIIPVNHPDMATEYIISYRVYRFTIDSNITCTIPSNDCEQVKYWKQDH